jgi:hypothetical protein
MYNNDDLFGELLSEPSGRLDVLTNTSDLTLPNQVANGQYMTPAWASSMLVAQFFPNIPKDFYLVEPSCGHGSFLNALPSYVDAVGVELDPAVAKVAEYNTGRKIYNQSILDFKPDRPVNAMVGNPPFSTKLLTAMLCQAADYLVDGGKIGLILSAHMAQYASTVTGWTKDYSIESHMLPRDIYRDLTKPLCFMMFTKEAQGKLFGFALYHETVAVNSLSKDIKRLFVRGGKGPLWARVVEDAILANGGKASLSQIYLYVQNRRPTENQFWKDKIRQVARQYFHSVSRGLYEHPNKAIS